MEGKQSGRNGFNAEGTEVGAQRARRVRRHGAVRAAWLVESLRQWSYIIAGKLLAGYN
jgi:hypothetical protein